MTTAVVGDMFPNLPKMLCCQTSQNTMLPKLPKMHNNRQKSVFGVMRTFPTDVCGVNIDIIDPATAGTLILIIDLHNFDLLITIYNKFVLVLDHEVLPDSQNPHLFRRFHFDHHVIQEEIGFALYGFEGLEDVAVLFAVEVQRVFRVEFCLQLLHCVWACVPSSDAITCILRPPSETILAKRKSQKCWSKPWYFSMRTQEGIVIIMDVYGFALMKKSQKQWLVSVKILRFILDLFPKRPFFLNFTIALQISPKIQNLLSPSFIPAHTQRNPNDKSPIMFYKVYSHLDIQIQIMDKKASKGSKDRIFNAALIRGPQYFEYEDYCIPVDNSHFDRYEIVQKVGRGKYSDVYKAVRLGATREQDALSVLKILKPIREAKIRREIKILKTLKHDSIIELEAVMYDQCARTYILAFEHLSNHQEKGWSDAEIRFYLKKLLEGLSYCHSHGIIHRDIKPQNVIIDKQRKELKIIDWGLADYYLPKRQFNVRVASRYYKGPQLLLNNNFYDYSLDIWSVGCWFAAIIFKKAVFFKGEDNIDQLKKIMQIVGSADIQSYIKKYGLKPDSKLKQSLKSEYPKIPFEMFQKNDNSNLATSQALDLLKQILVIDHAERITAAQALMHPYLAQVGQ